jgi:phage terminase large subunit-like protein
MNLLCEISALISTGNGESVEQITMFPSAAHDDMADMMSQASA